MNSPKRSWIELNKNPAGRLSNMGFGACTIADGLVRVLSFGFLHTRFTLEYARRQALAALKQMKLNRQRNQA